MAKSVSTEEVKALFDALLSDEQSREDVSEWAKARRESDDAGTLEYEPPEEEGRIWKALQYLEGIDLKDSPNSYLHSKADIFAYREQLDL